MALSCIEALNRSTTGGMPTGSLLSVSSTAMLVSSQTCSRYRLCDDQSTWSIIMNILCSCFFWIRFRSSDLLEWYDKGAKTTIPVTSILESPLCFRGWKNEADPSVKRVKKWKKEKACRYFWLSTPFNQFTLEGLGGVIMYWSTVSVYHRRYAHGQFTCPAHNRFDNRKKKTFWKNVAVYPESYLVAKAWRTLRHPDWPGGISQSDWPYDARRLMARNGQLL